MKKSKSKNKYAPKLEEKRPICPVCGKHPIETEVEEQKCRYEGHEFKVKEAFFRCYQDGEIYSTPDMVAWNNSQLRAHILKFEMDKKADDVKIPSAVKQTLDNEKSMGSTGGDA